MLFHDGIDITEDFERYVADAKRLRPLWDVIADSAVVRFVTEEQANYFRVKAAIELAVAASQARLEERERCAKVCEEMAEDNEDAAETLELLNGPAAAATRRWRASDCRELARRIRQG